jgi:uncharacterized protein YndB with AHSA1/START domain
MTQQETVDLQLIIAASAEAIFRALTEADELCLWFAEHVEVSLPDRRYRFWGRYTPEAPPGTAKLQTLLAAEPNCQLSYGWRLHDRDTIVTIDLEPTERGTKLRLRHQGVRPHQPNNYTMGDFWSLAMENLRSQVERGSTGGLFCDFSDIQQGPEVRLNVEIDAPSKTVFKALIKPSELNRYIAQDARVDPQVGGVYTYGWDSGGPVRILELIPNKELSLHWEYAQEPDTVLTWTLDGSGGKTRLTLVHSGFAPSRHNADYQVGWLNFMNRIKFMVEGSVTWQKPEFLAMDYA